MRLTFEPGGRRRGSVQGAATTIATLIAVSAFVPACRSSASGRQAGATRAATSEAIRAATSKPSVIIDTDLSLWWDDPTAIGLANVLQQRRAIRILGVVSDVPNAVAVAAGRNARNHSMLSVGADLPPNRSHMPCETGLALSLTESSCGPVKNARNSRAPASGLACGPSTMSEPAMAARTGRPAKTSRSGKLPMKPPTLPSAAT